MTPETRAALRRAADHFEAMAHDEDCNPIKDLTSSAILADAALLRALADQPDEPTTGLFVKAAEQMARQTEGWQSVRLGDVTDLYNNDAPKPDERAATT